MAPTVEPETKQMAVLNMFASIKLILSDGNGAPYTLHFHSLDEMVLHLAKHGQANLLELALKHEAWERECEKRRFYRRPHDEVDGPMSEGVHAVLRNVLNSVELRYGLQPDADTVSKLVLQNVKFLLHKKKNRHFNRSNHRFQRYFFNSNSL